MRYQIPRTIGRSRIRFFLMLFGLSLLIFAVTTPFVTAESLNLFTIQSLPHRFRVTAQSTATLSKGKFLVASRNLNDPNFAESVILLLDYNENGALGVIINRPTEVSLAKLLPGVKALRKRKDVAYIGGPVARYMVMILTQTAKPPQDAQRVLSDIYLISQQSELERVLRTGRKRTPLRAYVGYAGWAAGQLEMEVARGGWLIVPAETALIFDKPPVQVWPELIRRGEALWTYKQQLKPLFLFASLFTL